MLTSVAIHAAFLPVREFLRAPEPLATLSEKALAKEVTA